MYKNTMNVAKGVGVGLLTGAAVAAVAAKAWSNNHKTGAHMRKSAGKAMHTVGNLISDVERMLK